MRRSLSLVWRYLRYQNRLFWRTPIAAFFTLLLPLTFLLLFRAIFGNDDFDTPYGRLSVAQFYAPALGAFAAVSATYTNLAIGITTLRDDGVLKRVRGTPLPSWIYLAGAVGSAVWLAFIGVFVMMAIGVVAFDVNIEAAKLPAAALTFAVGVATFAALGLALASIAKNARSAPAIANATILPLAFISNVFVSLGNEPPAWLDTVGDIFPLKPFVEAFSRAFSPFTDAPAFSMGRLAVVAAWGLVGAALAIRTFKWESEPGTQARSRSRGSRRAKAA